MTSLFLYLQIHFKFGIADDNQGLGAAQGFTLTVLTNSAPVIRSTAEDVVNLGDTYQYDVVAVDPDNQSLTYRLDDESVARGMRIDELGRLRWTPDADQVATDLPVTVTVSDELGATAEQSFTVSVVSDDQAPLVSLNPSLNPLYLGQDITFYVTATDNIEVTNLQVLINDEAMALNGGQVTIEQPPAGVIEATVIATDAAGNTTTESISVDVLDDSDVNAPVIDLPAIDGVVTGLIEIRGTVTDDTDAVSYSLAVAPLGIDEFREVFSGDGSVDDGVLGTFDPTLLANDAYTMRLSATDGGGNTVFVDSQVDVGGDLKLGNFTLSFTDLEIPVSGIPISVTRTYDSLNANTTDDFGYGWRLEFRDTDLRTNVAPPSEEQTLLGRLNGFTDQTRVYVTLPGGKREGFTFAPQRAFISNYIPSVDGYDTSFYEPAFKADDGVTNTLSVRYDGYINRRPDGTFMNVGGASFNPENAAAFGGVYVLTTKAGIEYEIDAKSGDVLTITDLNGNTVSFDDNGIYSDTGKQVTFKRDAQGRITSVVDPDGNEVVYGYDANGDLISVTDREQNTTTLDYHDQRDHYLDSIIDPLGREGVRAQYDQQTGRLTQLLDVNGEAVELIYDPDNSIQTVKDVFGNPTTYEYDPRGNVVQEVDAVGKITKRTYDDQNNLLTETIITDESGPEGWTTTYTYDRQGNELSRTNALGETDRYTYNSYGQLLTSTDALGNTTEYTFDKRGNVTSKTDAEGNTTTYEYDLRGNPLSIKEGDDDITQFRYDRFGNRTLKIDALGNETSYTHDAQGNQKTETMVVTTPDGPRTLVITWDYDDAGNITSVLDAENGLTQYEYDDNGNRTAIIDSLGRRTEMRYDKKNNLIETIYPDDTPDDLSDNPRMGTTYDEAGNRDAITDPDGRTARYSQDPLNRPTGMLIDDDTPDDLTDNSQIGVDYDQAGRMSALISENGTRSEVEYDDAGRIILSRTFDGDEVIEQRSTYDAAGRVTSTIDALDRTTTYRYDGLGQKIETIYADGTSTKTAYDAAGNVIARTDQKGRTTTYEYDALDQLTAVVDAAENRIEYEYDEVGNLVLQRDANQHETRYEYDGLGRQTAIARPLGQRAETAYDDLGRVRQTTDFNGRRIEYIYDEQTNQVATLKFLDEDRTVDIGYSEGGRREEVNDARGKTVYDYDVQGRLQSRIDPDGQSIAYTYTKSGKVESLTTTSGTTTYQYDELDRLDTVTKDGQLTNYDYDNAGNLTRITYPNGVVEDRVYNDLNRLTSVTNTHEDGTVLSRYIYTLDKLGQQTKVEELSGRTVEYDYDALNRLVKETITDPTTGTHIVEYVYDDVGNRLSKSDSMEGTTTYTYDDNDRLTLEVGPSTTTQYTYDNNGNVVKEEQLGSPTLNYTWDSQDRLTAVEVIDGIDTTTIEYQYNLDGIRVSSTVNEEETRYLIDANRPYAEVVEEYTPGQTPDVSYVHGIEIISQTQGGESDIYLYDGHSGVRQLTDETGQVTDSYTFDAYGNVIDSTGTSENNYLYRGEQDDPNVDFQYLRARYYDTDTGRFMSTDPFVGLQELPISRHRYVYGNDNPVSFSDPSGNFPSLTTLAAGYAISSVLISTFQYTFGAIALTLGSQDQSAANVWNVGMTGIGFSVPLGASTKFLDINKVNNGQKVSQLFASAQITYGASASIDFGMENSGGIGSAKASLARFFGDNPSYFSGASVSLEGAALATAGYSVSIFTLGFGIGWSYPTSILPPSDYTNEVSLGVTSAAGFAFPISSVKTEPTSESDTQVNIPSEVLPYV